MSDNTAMQFEQGQMPLDYEFCLNDVALAKSILERADQTGGKISDAGIVFALRNILKMKYYPVAVKYFFDEKELDDFKRSAEYKTSLHPVTFCAYVAASRQRGGHPAGDLGQDGVFQCQVCPAMEGAG